MQASSQEPRFQLDDLPSMSASIHIHHHPYFKKVINDNLEAYIAAPTKIEKDLIISNIIFNFTKDGGILLNPSLCNNYLLIEKDLQIQHDIVEKIFVNTINKSIAYRKRQQREQKGQPMQRQKSRRSSDSHCDNDNDSIQVLESKTTRTTMISEEETIDDSNLDFNFTAKSLHKNRVSLYGKWILDKRLGSPCMRGCLEVMSIPKDLIGDHISKDQHDIMCHIDLSDTHIKIKSFYLQDFETPPKVVTLPFGREIVENHGAKRTLVTSTSTNPSRVIMKRSIMTHAGFIEYSDMKEIVYFANVENIPRDYTDRPSLLMRQSVSIMNHESGKKHSLIRYYLPVEA